MIILSILIPTYNRCKKLLDLLDFLELELSLCEKKIEVIIGDNASTDITYEEVCQHSLLDNENVFIYRNSTNLGLVGNLIELSKRANGEYIWFMGDDDIYRTGIVSKALGGISNEPALVFLNHEAYVEGQKGYSGFTSAISAGCKEVYEDGKVGISDIWHCSETSLMFISCLIYSRKLFLEAVSVNLNVNLASPLFYSLYVGGKGKLCVVKEIMLENVWGDVSWSAESEKIFFKYIPRILLSCINYGYSYKFIVSMLLKYFKNKKKGFVKYMLK